MDNFQHGPFNFEQGERLNEGHYWRMGYGNERLAELYIRGNETKASIIDAFSESRGSFIRSKRPASVVQRSEPVIMARLVTSTEVSGVEGETLDSFPYMSEIPGLSAGMINDLAETWLVVEKLGRSVAMTRKEFDRIKPAHVCLHEAEKELQRLQKAPAAHPNAWIASLLPDSVLTDDPERWRAPSSWEIRHVVGDGSFTGVSGAKAAAIVGVTPQNFRKYTAADGATTRQSISFSMWHYLLHRLGVNQLRLD